jgi:CRP-like cAMP-binding protein
MQAIRTSVENNSTTKSTQEPAFSARHFLDSAGVARNVTEFKTRETIFSQGDRGKNVLLRKGGVRLSVVKETREEAAVGVLGPGDLFGEGRLAGQRLRIGMAIAGTGVLAIEKKEMIRPPGRNMPFRPFHFSYAFEKHSR